MSRILIPRSRRPAALAAVAAMVLAGCIVGTDDGEKASDEETPSDTSWSELALPYGEPHDHSDASHHADLTTPNFEILGHSPLISDSYGTTPQGYLCGDAKPTEDGRRLAVVESRSDVAFAIADVTDPAKPEWLGELVMRTTYVYDLAVVPDGRHVVLVTVDPKEADRDPGVLVDDGPMMEWRSPCAPGGTVPVGSLVREEPVPRPVSLLLVSIEDPANPVIVDQRPLLGLGHSVSSTQLGGRTWVAASTYATNSGLSNYQFYYVTDTPAGAVLEYVSTYALATQTQDPDALQRALGHNDAWITEHPATGQSLAWLAHWNHGLLILDLADPMRPQLIGSWSDWQAGTGADTGQVHSVYPLEDLRNGRHFTVIGPELEAHPPSYPTGIVHVLDTTDPANPFEVGAWTLPHEVDWSGRLMFSTHYLGVVNRTLFVSMYHAGVWAIDLTPVYEGAEWTNLESIGVFMPVRESPKPPQTPYRWPPTLEEALPMPDGSVVTFDANSGLYTFRFDDSAPMPAPEPWPLTPPR